MSLRPVVSRRRAIFSRDAFHGYTLVEILVAVTLTLIMMTAVVQVFSGVGAGIGNSRRALEAFGRLRAAQSILRMDLQGVTVTMQPPRKPEAGEGYFEYIENGWADAPAVDSLNGNVTDTTVGQRGDILMFTTRNSSQPFVGRCNSVVGIDTIQSDVAEVAWFLRGHTLHRRVLLVSPGVTLNANANAFYASNDISVHVDYDPQTGNKTLVANSLSSLAKRENRYGHPMTAYPFDVRGWGWLGLPTLWECCLPGAWAKTWASGSVPVSSVTPPSLTAADLWAPLPSEMNGNAEDTTKRHWIPDYYLVNSGNFLPAPSSTQTPARVADDVVMTNVIGFDVKAWDPEASRYVDLGATNAVTFADGRVDRRSGLSRVYDTWSTHYENQGFPTVGSSGQLTWNSDAAGRATNGFDDDGNGIVDDQAEWITAPPYLAPLRGIQVKIRVFEPDSRQIREVTVEQDFPVN